MAGPPFEGEIIPVAIFEEGDLWNHLQRALRGEFPSEATPDVILEGDWAALQIYLPNTPVDASISPPLMQALVELQHAIYRSHSILSTGERSAKLPASLKERLEFRVQVTGGSSNLSLVDLPQILQAFGQAVLGKMTGDQIFIVVLTVVILFGSGAGLRMLLNAQNERRKAELEDKDKQRQADQFKAMLDVHADQQGLLLEAMERIPLLREVKEEAEDAQIPMLRALAKEGGGRVRGVDIPADVANDLASLPRKRAKEQTIRSAYRVAKVDTTAEEGFRVTLRDLETGSSITATLQDALISDEHRRRIRDAEWGQRPIVVELFVRRTRTQVAAVVIDVQDFDPDAFDRARGV